MAVYFAGKSMAIATPSAAPKMPIARINLRRRDSMFNTWCSCISVGCCMVMTSPSICGPSTSDRDRHLKPKKSQAAFCPRSLKRRHLGGDVAVPQPLFLPCKPARSNLALDENDGSDTTDLSGSCVGRRSTCGWRLPSRGRAQSRTRRSSEVQLDETWKKRKVQR